MPHFPDVRKFLDDQMEAFARSNRSAVVTLLIVFASVVGTYNYLAISSSFTTAQDYYQARQLSWQVLESLFSEESSLRGYSLTHDSQDLVQFSAAHTQYDLDFAQLQHYLWTERLRTADPFMQDAGRMYVQWMRTVARPILDHPAGALALTRQRSGEVLLTTLGADVASLTSLLDKNVDASSREMRVHIVSAIAQMALLTVLFGLTVLSMRRSIRRVERIFMAGITDANRTLISAQRLAGVGNWSADIDTGEVKWSAELYRIFGLEHGPPPPGLLRAFDHPDDAEAIRDAVEEFHRIGRPYRIDHRIVLRDGSIRHVQEQAEYSVERDGTAKRVIGTLLDVTERKAAEERLAYLAHHDALTGLPNRTMLAERLEHSMAYAQRQGRHVAVLFLDLDRFKVINDTRGHVIGDELLKQVAGRLRMVVRATDTVARSGGDEFIVVVGDLSGPSDLISVGKSILASFVNPFVVEGEELFVSPSIGVSVYPRDGDDVGTLVKNADAALYQAKDRGRNNIQYFTAELMEAAARKMSLESDMRRGLDREEFRLFYQPIVALRTGKIAGFEALLRWHHPTLGLILPQEFVPVAEDSGLIVQLGEWVLRSACAQQKRWERAGYGALRVTVNISARQFQHRDLAGIVERAIADTGIGPGTLELELTESLLMNDVTNGAATLAQLRAMGVSISIDDFGTGYSSLGYLKSFPIDSLKIDRSFVSDITGNRFDGAIATAIVALARSLDLHVIAEGVETVQQLAQLRRLGCDEAQGYLFGEPAVPEVCATLLGAGDPWPLRVAERA
jgi:diguanylate cyclase (GGDEF)-like protein/PAS domain S-box-containing protein